uniref:Ig-like domain-containing protein n=1 Tax=Mola mola TaxID=94237 RepID=A0A3Q3VM91_MOLML
TIMLMFGVLPLLMGLHAASAVTHTLKYFCTTSSGVPNFPEFVAVGLVDEAQMIHYDNSLGRLILKQDWMQNITAADPRYLEVQTELIAYTKKAYKANLEIVRRRLNQTGGVRILQNLYGCSWDDETRESNGFYQFGYDGEDFLSFDLTTETWIASKPEAVATKHKLDHNYAKTAYYKNFFTHECIYWLKRYLDYGRSSLLRTEFPSVSLLQKVPSSPVRCHATGFYPDRATLIWRKDEKELCNFVDHGEILPNHDGTFQMSVVLNLSSVKPEDWGRYDCQFQFSGMKEGNVSRLDKDKIRTNWGKNEIRGNEAKKPTELTVIIIVVVLALVLIVIVIVYKGKSPRPTKKLSGLWVLSIIFPVFPGTKRKRTI